MGDAFEVLLLVVLAAIVPAPSVGRHAQILVRRPEDREHRNTQPRGRRLQGILNGGAVVVDRVRERI